MRLSSRITLLFVVVLLLTSSSFSQRVFYFAQIGQGIFQTIRFDTTLVLVNTGGEVSVEIEFFSTGSGAPLDITLEGLGTDSSFVVDLPEGGSVSLKTAGEGGIVVGYARVTDPRIGPGGVTPNRLGGTAVFTRTDLTTGIKLYEAGVPASETLNTFTIFVDTLGDLDTGLALVNPVRAFQNFGGGAPEIGLSLRNTNFDEVAQTVIPLAAGEHVARFIGQIFGDVPEANEMQGTVVVNSPDAQLVAVTLRQNDIPGVEFPNEVPTLTAFPVVPRAAAPALGLPALGQTQSGSFSVLDSGRLAVTLRIPDLPWIRQVRLRFLKGDFELGSVQRHAAAGWTLSDVFEFPGSSSDIDRIEVELSGDDGSQTHFFVVR